MEDPQWLCFVGVLAILLTMHVPGWPSLGTRPPESIAVLSMKFTQHGFLTMVKEGLLTMQHEPERKCCVYGALHRQRSNADSNVLYVLSSV